MPKPWAPATTTCCTADVSQVVGGLSQCRPSRSEFSNKVSEFSSLSAFSDASELTFAAGLIAFRLEELRGITRNFLDDFLLGEGGFGTVHKGFIGEKLRRGLKPQVVAVKLLDVHGPQGHREWLAEVMILGQFRHPHLVKLLGYCCEAQERLLVYEFMPRGSLENHLFRRNGISLSWENRMRIAVGTAKGLAFLHGAEIPVIYRDFKTSNILLDLDYTAKLSDFGLAKTGPEGEATHVTTRVMGTHGYAAPEYIVTGHLSTKSDVYSFGVVLLELLTGRRTIDQTKRKSEKKLVEWVKPYLTSSRRLRYIMDPQLAWQYSVRGAKGAAMLALQCVSSNPKDRPQMAVVVKMLEKLQNLEDMAVDTGMRSRPTIAGGRSMKFARVNLDIRMKSRQIPFSGKL